MPGIIELGNLSPKVNSSCAIFQRHLVTVILIGRVMRVNTTFVHLGNTEVTLLRRTFPIGTFVSGTEKIASYTP